MKFDETPAHAVYSESVYARDEFGWAALRALRIGQWKFIDAPRAELYDLEKDPRELSNILRANSAEATTLRAELSKLLTRYAPEREGGQRLDTSDGTRTALESLGYLSGTQRERARRGPRSEGSHRRISAFEKSLDAFYAHRLDGGDQPAFVVFWRGTPGICRLEAGACRVRKNARGYHRGSRGRSW